MITSLPAVQHSCKVAWRRIKRPAGSAKRFKTTANRCHRRTLNRATRLICRDPEWFYDECFNAPSLSSWDIY